jgi:hypothetical protein
MPLENSSTDPHASAARARPENVHSLDAIEADMLLVGDGHTPDEIAQARRNIADWSEYLPADCVRMMIALGWHFSIQL